MNLLRESADINVLDPLSLQVYLSRNEEDAVVEVAAVALPMVIQEVALEVVAEPRLRQSRYSIRGMLFCYLPTTRTQVMAVEK